MPTWMLILLGIVVLIIVAGVVLQLPSSNRFVDVAGGKDLEKLRAKLDAGGDPNSRGTFGLTALHAAVGANQTENVRLLLDRGANIAHPEAKTPILLSLEKSAPKELVQLLLDRGADPTARGPLDRTAMEEAVDDPRLDQLRAYLQHGADPNSLGCDHESLLFSAIRRCTKYDTEERVEVVRLLLEHGANPNSRTRNGGPLLAFALENTKVLRLLLEHGAIKDVAWNGIEYCGVIDALLDD